MPPLPSNDVISYEPSCWPISSDIGCSPFYGSATSRSMELESSCNRDRIDWHQEEKAHAKISYLRLRVPVVEGDELRGKVWFSRVLPKHPRSQQFAPETIPLS